MASIILSAAGSAVGAATGIPMGAGIGARFGQTIGRIADSTFLSPTVKLRGRHGARLTDLGVQTSTYGKMIPIVYGTVRIGGNIIWSRPISEAASTSTSTAGGKGGGGKVTQSSTSYSYSVTLAIAICEGEINEVLRIWADAKQLDLSQYTMRIYKGSESQLPDTMIESYEGVGNTPAYRGLAYVVLEDFPLGDFGNRIPNFTFEVKKKALYPDYNDEILEEMITGIVMIPGAGEYVYDTQVEYKIPGAVVGSDWVQQGSQSVLNMHNAYGKANALLSLDQLAETLPNVEWVSVVVSWFGDTLDAASCVVKPGVEYQSGATTSPDTWQVSGFTRSTARQITLVSGTPQYGGTPDDNGIIRFLDALLARGYKIAFYPMMFMDMSGKPWRGELTGSAASVASFFTKTYGYNDFINHYASLVFGRVDAFIIGSELKGLTKVSASPGVYPAVMALASLAASVKSTLGGGVKITYAADWSEYHHTDGGWYNLDSLWASPDIDMIGIDAYFPLTDAPQSGYDIDGIKAGWTSGEGYDFYYTDPARTATASLSAAYAWKNLAWFWNNTHTNPDASTTAWTSQMKKIWFTEYGFPSVDGASNQPNVFYDPSSSLSGFPYFSKGRIDFRAQRAALIATEQQWKASAMVEKMFVWAWDARPFPYWPDLTSVWSDGAAWKTGHWVQGKLGLSSLAAVTADLCMRSGLEASDIDVSRISDQLEGYVIATQQTVRDTLETLQHAYYFDVVESDYVLKFLSRGAPSVQSIPQNDMIPRQGTDNGELFKITRAQEIELPKRVNVVYLDRLLNYQNSTQYSQREATLSREIVTLDLPLVMADQIAKNIADIRLFSDWLGRTSYQFDLPVAYARLEPTDVVTATVGGVTHRMRITSVRAQAPGILRVQAVAEDISAYDFYTAPASSGELLTGNASIPKTHLELLDIPAFPGDDADKGVIRMGAVGLASGWTGSAIYRSDDGGASYGRISDLTVSASIGTASGVLGAGTTAIFDEKNSITVVLLGEATLSSATELAVLNGANAALLGNEIIQFKTATLIEPFRYTLSGLLRGRMGTEWAIGAHAAGERFILLDGRIGRQVIGNGLTGLLRNYKAVTFGSSLSLATAQDFTYGGTALRPYSPVHIEGTRDGGGDLTVNWVRRTRLGGNWQDGIDVPLNEAAEAYEVEIMNGSSVVRTITGISAASVVYSAAQQTTDFGSPQASVSVKIYQMSSIIGRGYAGAGTV